MNVKLLVTALFAILNLQFSARAQEIEENLWMDKPFIADGNPGEWGELSQFNSDTKLAFALANDANRLYIVLESLDPVTTRSFLMGGVTLNINTSGKKKKSINLIFPFHARLGGPPPEPRDSSKAHQPPIEMVNDPTMLSKASGLKITGLKNLADTVLTDDNTVGVEFGMVVNGNQDLVYELSVPLAQLGIDATYTKAIAYNIKLNTSGPGGKKPKEGGERSGGKAPGGGMGGRGGGMGGSGGGMGGGGGRRMGGGKSRGGESGPEAGSSTAKSDFWIKYKLVKS
ncbi:hypothetical protein ACJVDH_07020 [Pedobacter sp. AW1-32]|uniref:hypothetical protein n=1 Tax=Pedobacter sp. AW1-32 TaxID=3383026 RepID=UPI003FEDAD3D